MKKTILHILLLLVCGYSYAQDKSNKGTEFWLGYGHCISFDIADYGVLNNQEEVLYISADEACEVTVSVNNTSWTQTVSIAANSMNVGITLPKSGAADCRIMNEGIFDRAIHIVSTKPVVVYAHLYNTQLSGATMLFPVEAYGYSYYSVNYKQPPVPGYPGRNWFYVIAAEDNTTLQITPSDTTESGVLPGQTITVNLHKGELYNVFAKVSDANECDLTGSKIVSVSGADGNCHPVAVFSGASRFILCLTDGGEVAQQQVFPASAWGTRYLSFHSIIATSNPLTTPFLNVYRVLVANPATIVKRNGTVLTGLQQNCFYEFTSTSGDYIEADNPVMVCQYSHNSNECTGNNMNPMGDPELIFLTPIEQGIKKATVYNTKNRNITVNYLTVIIPNDGINSLKIDGTAVPASQRMLHPNNPGYTVVAKRLLGPGAQHSIESDSAFSATIFGAGVFESYGYIAGTLVNNLNSTGSIKNVFNISGQPDTFTCPSSPFTISIQIAYRANTLQWLRSQVPGMSPSNDTSINNPVPVDSQLVNGRKYYRYSLITQLSLSDTGVFYLPVVYTSPQIDHCSHLERTTIPIVVKQGPVADFNYRYHGCNTDTAFFSALPDINGNPLYQYNWQFNDTSTDTGTNTFFQFEEGTHPVRLQVIADNGCLDDTSRLVNTHPKPVALFGINHNTCAGDSVLFTDSSFVPQGMIDSWNWNFSDGSSSSYSSNNPFFHSFTSPAVFNVSLVVQSAAGCNSDTSWLPVQINARPQVAINLTGKPCVDSSFQFSTLLTENGNSIQTVWWDFGDGNTLVANNTNPVNHEYSLPGNAIPVRCVVEAGAGCVSDTAVYNIDSVSAAPIADFSINASAYCPGNDISFNYTGTGNISHWRWNMGNGFFDAAPPVINRFGTGGAYPVTLIVQTPGGCSSPAFTKQVNIYAAPAIDAGPTLVKTFNQPITLQASMSDTGAFQYYWTPAATLDDGFVLHPVSNATNDVLYTIRVTGGPGNCEASDTVSVIVVKDIYIPTAFNGDHGRWNIPALNGNPNARVIIYNRWGQKIFESKGYNTPWDGTYKGIPQPIGAYIYQVQPDFRKPRVLTGTVTIVR